MPHIDSFIRPLHGLGPFASYPSSELLGYKTLPLFPLPKGKGMKRHLPLPLGETLPLFPLPCTYRTPVTHVSGTYIPKGQGMKNSRTAIIGKTRPLHQAAQAHADRHKARPCRPH